MLHIAIINKDIKFAQLLLGGIQIFSSTEQRALSLGPLVVRRFPYHLLPQVTSLI